MESDGRLTRGMLFGNFANKWDGIPLIPRQIAYWQQMQGTVDSEHIFGQFFPWTLNIFSASLPGLAIAPVW